MHNVLNKYHAVRRALLKSRFRLLFIFCVYLLLVFIVTLTLIWRFPNNIFYANFYAEDGSVFLQNIIDKGWLHALVTPFNGYSVIGMYLIEGFGWILNVLFGHEGLLSLPAYFALASIIFMASVIALPYLLFRKSFGVAKTLIIVLFGALVPLPSSPHIVIGTVGNQKWMFMYLAFLLVLYRLKNYKKLSLYALLCVDIGLLISAYTNTTVYLLIPLLAIPYLHEVWVTRRKGVMNVIRKLIMRPDTISLVLLIILLLPQVLYVALNGIPKLPGYLDSPYNFQRTIEIFIHRTYLFGITSLFNKYMSDLVVLGIFGVIVALGWRYLKKFERTAFFIGLYAAGVASALFVLNRPGVSDFFFGYMRYGSGPDQFFYAQTLIMYIPIVLLAFALAYLIKNAAYRYAAIFLFVAFVVLSAVISNAILVERWRNASVFENDGRTFINQSIVACNQRKGDTLNVVVYPYSNGQFDLAVKRSLVCNKDLANYQKSITVLGLSPDNNTYLTILPNTTFTQTFIANEPNLAGIQVFLSTFGNERRSGSYALVVYDSTCKQTLRTVAIPNVLLDNTFYNARFTPIKATEGNSYCFSIIAPTVRNASPIAVQLSAPEMYKQGSLTINGSGSDRDIVFSPLFSQKR